MSSHPTIASETELVPANCFQPLDLLPIFGRVAPLEVDLGCGDGSFLVARAVENRVHDFLGIERLLGRVRTACRKIERAGLTNARVLRFEITYAVEHLLPDESVAALHIMFPDPWPKRRHAGRRLLTAGFLASMHRALQPDGTVLIATDDSEYFRQISQLAAQSPQFAIAAGPSPPPTPSRFEKRFTDRGVPIHRLALRKVSRDT